MDDLVEVLTRIAEALEDIEENVRIKKNHDIISDRAQEIDKGKIIALRNAHWTYKDIADEVGCSKSEVAYIVRKYGQKRTE